MDIGNKSSRKNLITGKENYFTNHGFAVNKEELDNNPDLEITHLHLNDGTVAGMRMKNKKLFSVCSTIRKQVQDLMIRLICLINLLKILKDKFIVSL
jgi:hypothetical protein